MITEYEEAVLHVLGDNRGFHSPRYIYMHLPKVLRTEWTFTYFTTSVLKQMVLKDLVEVRPPETKGRAKLYKAPPPAQLRKLFRLTAES